MFTSRITNGLRFAIKNRQSFLHTSTPIKSKEINTIDTVKYTTSITGFLVVLTCLNVLNVSTTHNNRKHVQEIIRKSEDEDDEDDKKNGGGGTPIYL
jgi:hypothetical protein